LPDTLVGHMDNRFVAVDNVLTRYEAELTTQNLSGYFQVNGLIDAGDFQKAGSKGA